MKKHLLKHKLTGTKLGKTGIFQNMYLKTLILLGISLLSFTNGKLLPFLQVLYFANLTFKQDEHCCVIVEAWAMNGMSMVIGKMGRLTDV